MIIRRKKLTLAAFSLFVLLFASAFIQTEGKKEVPYPTGFRKWTHVKSAVILEGHPTFKKYGGYHHIYANEKAMEGFANGLFPDGSQIVFEVIEMQTENNQIVEGTRKFIDVMYKDARFKETGGWGYDEFEGDAEVRAKIDPVSCYTCHTTRQKQGYVFSAFRK